MYCVRTLWNMDILSGIGLPFMMISAAINSMIRADGSPKYAMFSMVIGAIINVILDPVFIFVFHMGVQGAAIATIIGQIASFAVSVVYMPRFKTVRPKSDAFRLNGNTCGNIITFGLSSFITQFAITIVMALTNNLLSFYGAASPYGAEIPLTATGIVMKVNQIMIAILLGIATGTQPIIGFNYGARNYKRVRKALEISLIASEVVSVAAFFIFQFAPMSVISLFGAEDDLYNTFATMALQNGVDVKTVSNMLGHYDAGFTLRTYTHATRQMQQQAAEKMGNFMKQVL